MMDKICKYLYKIKKLDESGGNSDDKKKIYIQKINYYLGKGGAKKKQISSTSRMPATVSYVPTTSTLTTTNPPPLVEASENKIEAGQEQQIDNMESLLTYFKKSTTDNFSKIRTYCNKVNKKQDVPFAIDIDNLPNKRNPIKNFTVDIYGSNGSVKKNVGAFFDSGYIQHSLAIKSSTHAKDLSSPKNILIVINFINNGGEVQQIALTAFNEKDCDIYPDSRSFISNEEYKMDLILNKPMDEFRQYIYQYNRTGKPFDILIGMRQMMDLAKYNIFPIINGDKIPEIAIPFHNFYNSPTGIFIEFCDKAGNSYEEQIPIVIDSGWYSYCDLDIYWENPIMNNIKKWLEVANAIHKTVRSTNFILDKINIYYNNKLIMTTTNIPGENRQADIAKYATKNPVVIGHQFLQKLYDNNIYPSGALQEPWIWSTTQ